ncbi:type II secretion system F family protein [Terasakiella pusilla]|uniref:type II secretion system F family protein n=1 Tax=Terasakiella pusilla TaxID=64973 RepID=UPI003AA88E2D
MADVNVALALGVVLIGAAMVLFALFLTHNQNLLAKRLGATEPDHINSGVNAGVVQARHREIPVWASRLMGVLSRFGERLAGTENDRQQIRRLLGMAGYRSPEALGLIVLAKYVLGVFLLLLMVFVVLDAEQRFGLTGLAGGLIALFVGTLIPELLLKSKAARRGGALARSVPEGLDLMVICAEAGLPLGRVLQVVSKELGLSAPELADELRHTFLELQIAGNRSNALLNLSERCGVAEIESMVATLLQAERYGTPLSQALRTISEESRKSLILGLEEQAGKLPAQMSVPLMVLILPPIIAMMGAPAMVRLVRTLLVQ